jgi:hypothetical protein
MDNLGSHKGRAVRAAIRAAKAKLFFLPAYSPDLNPIEQAFAKMKTLLRNADARTIEESATRVRPPGTMRTPSAPDSTNGPGEPSAPSSTASRRQNAQTTSKTQDMLQPNQIAL